MKKQPKPTAPEKRPQTDTTALEDLPEVTSEEKAAQTSLMEAARNEEKLHHLGTKKAFEGETVFVRNDTGHLFTLGIPAKSGRGEHALNAAMQILPGVNRVDAAQWASAKEQKMVKLQISEGHLVEVGNTSLEDMSEKGAVRLVEATADKKLLLSWKDSEKREKVLMAINKNLKLIAPSKPKKESEEGQDEDESDDQE